MEPAKARRFVRPGVLCFVALFTLLYGAAMMWSRSLRTMTPREASVELAELSGAGLPASATGWGSLTGAIESCRAVADQQTILPGVDEFRPLVLHVLNSAIDDPSWPDGYRSRWESRIFADLEAAGLFRHLDALAGAQTLGRPASCFGLAQRMETGKCIRDVARVLRADIRRAAYEGDEGRFAQRVRQALGMARLLEREPDTDTVATGFGLRQAFLLDIRRAAAEFKLGEGTLRAVLREVDRIGEFDCSPMLRAQMVELRPLVDRLFTADGMLHAEAAERSLESVAAVVHRTSRITARKEILPPSPFPGVPNARGLFAARREETDRVLAEYFALCVDATPSSPGSEDPAEAYLTPERLARVPALWLARSTGGLSRGDFCWRARFEYQATRLVLAIAIYQSLHVLPPDSLDELDRDIVDPFPLDPWNGRDWSYTLYPVFGRPSESERFRLFGLGPNHKDDAGTGDDVQAIEPRREVRE